jgi:FkbH-like protein
MIVQAPVCERSAGRVAEILKSLDARPTTAAYARAARDLQSCVEDLRPLRVALLASVTLDPLVPYLEVEAARAGFAAAVYVGPFNAVQQALLDPDSGCQAHRPDVVIVACRLEELAPQLVSTHAELAADDVRRLGQDAVAALVAAVESFRQRSSAAIVVQNFPLPMFLQEGLHDASRATGQSQVVRDLNTRLREAVDRLPAVYVADVEGLCAQLGYRHCFDAKMWYLARAPFAGALLPELARLHIRFAAALAARRKKCLVVDLDNTLWGGVIGEDGLSGILLGQTFPGNVFCDVQRALKQLSRRGILLAINSKNNEADVREVFTTHPEMVLRLEDFAAWRINWQPKPDNIRELAEELNIGLDSFVFLDDHPAECERMRHELPEVLTWAAGDDSGRPDPLGVLQRLYTTNVFDRLSVTIEDQQRQQMYRQQAARRQAAAAASSLEEFLAGLAQQVEIRPLDEFTRPRVAELLQKTNQFNLTTRRHSAARLHELQAEPGTAVFSLRAVDKFGDNGIVGAAIIRSSGEIAALDSLLLSCRVIGRGIETALLSELVDWARQQGARWLDGEFVPTSKNAPAAELLPRHGFVRLRDDGVEGSQWRLDLREVPFTWPAYIRRMASGS